MDFARVSHFAPLSVWILQEFRIFQLCDTEMARERGGPLPGRFRVIFAIKVTCKTQ